MTPDTSFWTAGPSAFVGTSFREADPAIGGELSVMRHPATTWEGLFCTPSCVGGFWRVESKPSVARPSERTFGMVVGPQASIALLGLELGLAMETLPDGGRPLFGANAGAFLSVGAGSFGGCVTANARGFEGQLLFRATIPLVLPLAWFPRAGAVAPVGFTDRFGRFPM